MASGLDIARMHAAYPRGKGTGPSRGTVRKRGIGELMRVGRTTIGGGTVAPASGVTRGLTPSGPRVPDAFRRDAELERTRNSAGARLPMAGSTKGILDRQMQVLDRRKSRRPIAHI